jgi:hypothetical protein
LGVGQVENILNVGDSSYLNWLHTSYLPMLQTKNYVPNTKTQWGWYLWTMDGNVTNYTSIGTMINGLWVGNVKVDAGYPQTAAAWAASWAAYFKYAVDHNSPIRFSPHIGSMSQPDWTYFKTMYQYCPAILKEWFPLSQMATWGYYSRNQAYNQMSNLYWFANVAPPVFSNDPPSRIIDFGIDIDNGDIHTALAFYGLVRGPNTIFSALGPTASTAYNPAAWLPAATKLGSGTSAPQVIAGTAPAVLVRRLFQRGAVFFNYGAGSQFISLPTGTTDWNGHTITSLTLANGKGDVVFNTNTAALALTR